jgi:hypothetical protein
MNVAFTWVVRTVLRLVTTQVNVVIDPANSFAGLDRAVGFFTATVAHTLGDDLVWSTC